MTQSCDTATSRELALVSSDPAVASHQGVPGEADLLIVGAGPAGLYGARADALSPPDQCIDCAACEPVRPVEAVQPQQKLDQAWEPFQAVAREAVEPFGTPGGSGKVSLPIAMTTR